MTEGVPRIISTESAQLSKRCCLQPNECQQKRLLCAPVKAGVRGKTPVSCDGQLSYTCGSALYACCTVVHVSEDASMFCLNKN